MGKNKAQGPTLPRIRYWYMCFDLTHAPVATAARAITINKATGFVSMSQPIPDTRTLYSYDCYCSLDYVRVLYLYHTAI